jgi:type II secretory ATPase GspE/PulE/Tfp pilus assembly ATPase PilB-like protein
VLRILDRATAVLGLEQLGFAGDHLATFERLVTNPEGLVLVTGPTGSGKTTTLYAAIERVNTAENKILTAEDPIEYRFPKTNQKQVSEQMGFADYARAFLRQNPDIILIGEVRDEETADAAVRAAQTGHLVLSTLHTNDAVRTISRLRTLGVEPGMIASCLLGALSQRLVRRVCRTARRRHRPRPRRPAGSASPPHETFARGRGCEACGGRGTRGRTGLYELFVLDSELADRVARTCRSTSCGSAPGRERDADPPRRRPGEGPRRGDPPLRGPADGALPDVGRPTGVMRAVTIAVRPPLWQRPGP